MTRKHKDEILRCFRDHQKEMEDMRGNGRYRFMIEKLRDSIPGVTRSKLECTLSACSATLKMRTGEKAEEWLRTTGRPIEFSKKVKELWLTKLDDDAIGEQLGCTGDDIRRHRRDIGLCFLEEEIGWDQIDKPTTADTVAAAAETVATAADVVTDVMAEAVANMAAEPAITSKESPTEAIGGAAVMADVATVYAADTGIRVLQTLCKVLQQLQDDAFINVFDERERAQFKMSTTFLQPVLTDTMKRWQSAAVKWRGMPHYFLNRQAVDLNLSGFATKTRGETQA